MSAQREYELDIIYQAIQSELHQPPLGFSQLSVQERRRFLKPLNDLMDLLLNKVIGDSVHDQAGYLIGRIKKLYPRGRHMNIVVSEFEGLADYASLSRQQRLTHGRQRYKVFDEVLRKVSGSDTPETHRQFMNARFHSMHHQSEDFTPLVRQPSWKMFSDMIDGLMLANNLQYLSLNVQQKRASRRRQRYEILDKMIRLASGSDDIVQQEALVHDRLEHMHQSYRRYSYSTLRTFVTRLEPLEIFRDSESQNKLNRYKYGIAVELVNKLCGYTSDAPVPEIRAKFLRSRFPYAFQLT